MTPLVLTASLEIPAPPEAVWDVLVDVPRWTQWNPVVRQVVRFDEVAVGRRLAYVLRMGPGIPVSFDVELQVVDRPYQLQWWSTKWWGVTGTRAFRLSPIEGGTRVEDVKTFESRVWPVAWMYPRGVVRSMSDGWLEALAAEVRARGD